MMHERRIDDFSGGGFFGKIPETSVDAEKGELEDLENKINNLTERANKWVKDFANINEASEKDLMFKKQNLMGYREHAGLILIILKKHDRSDKEVKTKADKLKNRIEFLISKLLFQENKIDKKIKKFWQTKLKSRVENKEKEVNNFLDMDTKKINGDNAWRLFNEYFDNKNIGVGKSEVGKKITKIEQNLIKILEILLSNENNFQALEGTVLKKILNPEEVTSEKVDFYNFLVVKIQNKIIGRNKNEDEYESNSGDEFGQIG
jgi:hypothetical protein